MFTERDFSDDDQSMVVVEAAANTTTTTIIDPSVTKKKRPRDVEGEDDASAHKDSSVMMKMKRQRPEQQRQQKGISSGGTTTTSPSFHKSTDRDFSAVTLPISREATTGQGGKGRSVGKNNNQQDQLGIGQAWSSPDCRCFRCEIIRGSGKITALAAAAAKAAATRSPPRLPTIVLLDLDNWGFPQFQEALQPEHAALFVAPSSLPQPAATTTTDKKEGEQDESPEAIFAPSLFVWAFHGLGFSKFFGVTAEEQINSIARRCSKPTVIAGAANALVKGQARGEATEGMKKNVAAIRSRYEDLKLKASKTGSSSLRSKANKAKEELEVKERELAIHLKKFGNGGGGRANSEAEAIAAVEEDEKNKNNKQPQGGFGRAPAAEIRKPQSAKKFVTKHHKPPSLWEVMVSAECIHATPCGGDKQVADEVLLDVLQVLPPEFDVIVVSGDNELRDDAEKLGEQQQDEGEESSSGSIRRSIRVVPSRKRSAYDVLSDIKEMLQA